MDNIFERTLQFPKIQIICNISKDKCLNATTSNRNPCM